MNDKRLRYKVPGVIFIVLTGVVALVGSWSAALLGGMSPEVTSAYLVTGMVFFFAGAGLCMCGWN